jgi:DmsE family decaheme c-type cytochrome
MRPDRKTSRKQQLVIIALAGLIALFPILAFGEDEESNGAVETVAEYTGTVHCLNCHDTYRTGFLKTRHALSLGDLDAMPSEQGCEQCHGPGSLHVDNIGNETGERGIDSFIEDKADEQYGATCLKCHEKKIDPDIWSDGYHRNAEIFCADCHDTHNRENEFQLRKETRIELCYSCHSSMKIQFESGRSRHPLDDRGCVNCHDPHGTNELMLATELLDDTCSKCHPDKAGPFIYQHLSGTSDFGDGCMSCHMPHSSSNITLLKANGRALCLSCHTDKSDHRGAATCWTSGCHSAMHGSNNNMLFIR